jgi:hypothetical protein
LQRRAVRLNGPNILIFPGFAAFRAKAAPGAANRKRSDGQIEVQPKPKSAAKPKSGTPDAQTLTRIADALERLAPRLNSNSTSIGGRLHLAGAGFAAGAGAARQPGQMTLLKGIDRVRDTLMENTERRRAAGHTRCQGCGGGCRQEAPAAVNASAVAALLSPNHPISNAGRSVFARPRRPPPCLRRPAVRR